MPIIQPLNVIHRPPFDLLPLAPIQREFCCIPKERNYLMIQLIRLEILLRRNSIAFSAIPPDGGISVLVGVENAPALRRLSEPRYEIT
jgi:hypothetical protein